MAASSFRPSRFASSRPSDRSASPELRTGASGLGQESDPESVAREIALRSLDGAPRTRAQLADVLARKGVPDEVATVVLDRFTEVGLIDDERFAQMLVRARRSERGLARRALVVELERKGIAPETIARVLEEAPEEDDEAVARELVGRRLPGSAGLDRATRTRRLVSMLGRKGYPPGLALRVVREMVQEDTARLDDDGGGQPENEGE